jgi:hypothetical protein
MVRMIKGFILFSAVALFAAIDPPAFAISAVAPITWNGPVTISGDTNVSTDGTLVAAFNMDGPAVTVNGVPFAAFTYTSFTTSVSNGNFTFTESPGHILTLSGIGSNSAPFSNLSANYQTLLSTAISTDENNTLTLTMSGLVAGQQYQFQWWLNVSSTGNAGGFGTTATATNSVTLDDNTTNATGGVGQFVTGTFTAAGATQVIAFSGINSSNSPTIDAFQLRAVPEPTTVTSLVLGLGLLGLIARHPRKV